MPRVRNPRAIPGTGKEADCLVPPVYGPGSSLLRQRGEMPCPLQHIGVGTEYLHHLVLSAKTDRSEPQSH